MNFRQVHADFHTSEKIPDIGTRFSKEQFQEALKTGCVNSIMAGPIIRARPMSHTRI